MKPDLLKGVAALGALMWLLPIFAILAVLFGVILWAGFGWYGFAALGFAVWLIMRRVR